MVLAFLLARAGVDVVVVEKHADFLRDFRGDTVHPSTLEILYELGLLDGFLARPHQEARELRGVIGGTEFPFADFTHLPTHCRFVAFMPQWDFLDFLAARGRRFPGFHLRMRAEVKDLIAGEDNRVVGLRAATPAGPLDVRADLVVGADGRHSVVRDRAGLGVRDLGAPIDVLWMRLSRRPDDPDLPLGRFDAGRILVMINRGDYWQCGFVIPKGGFDDVRGRGIEAFRADIAGAAPFAADRVGELKDWDDVKLLTVRVDRLRRWSRAGLLCIGDAAHAMSPVGGVGINLAVQDAVAAANILAPRFRDGGVRPEDLRKVQRRREWPTRLIQGLQVLIHDRFITRTLRSGRRPGLPWLARLVRAVPLLRRVPARVIGIGFRPEHVATPVAG
jgi:2-polyprenyl-6-methoxyphenol hydroxylase-like FAD-dependent oxidoreductase